MKKKRLVRGASLCLFVPLFLMCLGVFAVSCKMTAEGIVTSSEDVYNPVLKDFSQVSSESLLLSFAEEVFISNPEIRSADTNEELVISSEQIQVTALSKEDGGGAAFFVSETSQVSFQQPGDSQDGLFIFRIAFDNAALQAGTPYVLSGVAQDKEDNSLFFKVPFYGFNSNVAGIVLSEVRIGQKKPTVEFIEFYVHSPGDLAGITLNTVNNDFEYVFPSIEVNAGEYIVLHMRTLSQESGHVDELGADLNLSTAPDSCEGVRDLWVSSEDRIISGSDVITLRERQNGRMVDALLYAQPDISARNQKKTLPIAQQIVEAGAWQGEKELSGWVQAEGLTNAATTRSLSRQNIQAIDQAAEAGVDIPIAGPQDWIITAKKGKVEGVTPGLPNSTNKYVAK